MNSPRILLLAATLCMSSFAGSPIPTAPIPADPHEPVTGGIRPAATPAERAVALSLLERARQNSKLHMPGTPPYRMVVPFTASGNVSHVGSGELTETWLTGQKWRWTAQLGGASVVRISNGFRRIAGNDTASVPTRVHMLRNAIFWAVRPSPSSWQLRTADIQRNGKPATCVLVSQFKTEETSSRAWNEEEYCIDKASGLLVSHSEAPGVYTEYGYAKAVQFHDQVMPDRITIYVGGAAVLEANFSITDAGSVDEALLTPTQEMLASGPPTTLEMPSRLSLAALAAAAGNTI